jgi:hypothetical protein
MLMGSSVPLFTLPNIDVFHPRSFLTASCARAFSGGRPITIDGAAADPDIWARLSVLCHGYDLSSLVPDAEATSEVAA